MGKARMKPVTCPYCSGAAELVDSDVVYGVGRNYGKLWLCRPCWAYVGVHKGSPEHKPLGTLADAETRIWRQRAHAVFDPMWRAKMARDGISKTKARGAAYKWLAGQLDINVKQCHISRFGVAECQRVVAICTPYQSSPS